MQFIKQNALLQYCLIYFQAFEELERLLSNRSICVAVKEKLTKDSGVAGASAYDHIVEKLLAKPKAKGEILLSSIRITLSFHKALIMLLSFKGIVLNSIYWDWKLLKRFSVLQTKVQPDYRQPKVRKNIRLILYFCFGFDLKSYKVPYNVPYYLGSGCHLRNMYHIKLPVLIS